jgi:hypothetical protein
MLKKLVVLVGLPIPILQEVVERLGQSMAVQEVQVLMALMNFVGKVVVAAAGKIVELAEQEVQVEHQGAEVAEVGAEPL